MTPKTLIKICGITRPEDGVAAIRAGADWLGLIRWPRSPRFRPIEQCAETLAAIRAQCGHDFQAVAVYVDAEAETIAAEAERAGFDRVQLHGGESLEFARSLPLPAIKVLKIEDIDSISKADDYPGMDLMTDTADPVLPGGTGRRGYDVALLAGLAARRRVIVAGGLDPENVGDAIKLLHPWGVDVSTGVETEPGVKDHEKIARFVKAVRQAEKLPRESG